MASDKEFVDFVVDQMGDAGAIRWAKKTMILTQDIERFREAARHLWNGYMRIDDTNSTSWDTVEEFCKIANTLFAECVLARNQLPHPTIPMDQGISPLVEYRIIAHANAGIHLLVNRDMPASGYWDHPITWIPWTDMNVIHPISFFDFDVRGWRRIQYYQARIVNCPSNPEINGRDALIECADVKIETTTAEPTDAAAASRGQ
jgi:hypothetical protein